jgi:hypothetical protein
MIVDAPWYVPNSLIRRDLSCPTVKEEIRSYSSHYGDRLRSYINIPSSQTYRSYLHLHSGDTQLESQY